MRWLDIETGNHVERVARDGDWMWIECVETGDRGRIYMDDYRAALNLGAWIPATSEPAPASPPERVSLVRG